MWDHLGPRDCTGRLRCQRTREGNCVSDNVFCARRTACAGRRRLLGRPSRMAIRIPVRKQRWLAIAIAAFFVVPGIQMRTDTSNGASMIASFLELLRQPRFCALVIHTGCSTGTVLIVATASSSLMKELLHRPATEFRFYFTMVPMGFIIRDDNIQPSRESRFRRGHDPHWGLLSR